MLFKGNDQKVYFDGELLASLTKAEAKASLEYEEIEKCGSYATEYEYTGYSIEGTIAWKKADSRVLAKYHTAIQNGNVPDLVVTGVNMMVNGKVESVTILDAKPTELSLLNAEAKAVTEEEIPFNASRYKVNSLIS